MSNSSLSAPWRIEYIRSLDKPAPDACFLCQAVAAGEASQQRDRLVLWRSALSIVVINRFPYTNGHLLIAPIAHKPELEDLSPEELADLGVQTTAAVRLLRRAVSPQGFNIGMNIGRCAGAGLPGHLHQHVVPRWNGDTNFMSIVGETRVVPQAVGQLYDELVAVRRQMEDRG